jgi:hypothetical protein
MTDEEFAALVAQLDLVPSDYQTLGIAFRSVILTGEPGPVLEAHGLVTLLGRRLDAVSLQARSVGAD